VLQPGDEALRRRRAFDSCALEDSMAPAALRATLVLASAARGDVAAPLASRDAWHKYPASLQPTRRPPGRAYRGVVGARSQIGFPARLVVPQASRLVDGCRP
jgi:hypothetical protein